MTIPVRSFKYKEKQVFNTISEFISTNLCTTSANK